MLLIEKAVETSSPLLFLAEKNRRHAEPKCLQGIIIYNSSFNNYTHNHTQTHKPTNTCA
jgi:hypothetical protein